MIGVRAIKFLYQHLGPTFHKGRFARIRLVSVFGVYCMKRRPYNYYSVLYKLKLIDQILLF